MEKLKNLSGAFIINKRIDMTSRYVDNFLLRNYRFHKVGHLGTLDPFASGVLVIFVNEGTKLIPMFESLDKEYIATIKLGIKTDTGDKDGSVIEEVPVPSISKKEITEYFKSILGENEQIPPMYSAIKKDGVPLYRIAREGKTIERQPRKFMIHEIELLDYENDTLTYRVLVSKGTYIRTLSEDIAANFKTVGHLVSLIRTKTGMFNIESAIDMEEINESNILTFENIFKDNATYEISDDEYIKVRQGEPLSLQFDALYVLIKYKNKSIAIYYKDQNTFRFKRGLN